MARRNLIEILINSKDNASRNIKGVINVLGDLGNAFTGLQAVAGVIGNIGRQIGELAQESASLETIESSFNTMAVAAGTSGDAILGAMKAASGYAITSRAAMESYNTATQLVGQNFANQLPDAMRYLSKVAAATGQDVGFMMDSLVKGVGRLSPMILDNLGIQVNMADAYQKWADENGRTVESMTKSEQQAAIMAETLALLEQNTANMPEVFGTAGQALGSMQANFEDFKAMIGTAFLPVLKQVAYLVNIALNEGMRLLEKPLKFVGTLLGDLVGIVQSFFNALSEGGDPLYAVQSRLEEMFDALDGAPIIGKAIKLLDMFREALGETGNPLQALRQVFLKLIEGTPLEAWIKSGMRIIESLGRAFYNAGQIIGPALRDAWLQVKGPLGEMFSALNQAGGEGAAGFAGFVENVLAPAIVTVATFLAEKAIPAIADLVTWLAEKVPPAIEEAKRWFQEEFLPAVQAAFLWVQENVVPIAEDLYEVILTKVVPAMEDLVVIIRDDILAHFQTMQERTDAARSVLETLWEHLSTNLAPIFEEVARIMNEILLPAFRDVWEFVETSLLPVAEALGDVFSAVIEVAFRAIAAIWENHLEPALEALWLILKEKLGLEGDKFALVWERVKDAMEGLKGPLQTVVDKLGSLADKVRNVELPEWMMGHSPSPWQLWIEGVAGAMDELSKKSIPGMDRAIGRMALPELGAPTLGAPAMAAAAAGGAAGGSMTTNNLTITVLAENGQEMFDSIEREAQRRGLSFTEVS